MSEATMGCKDKDMHMQLHISDDETTRYFVDRLPEWCVPVGWKSFQVRTRCWRCPVLTFVTIYMSRGTVNGLGRGLGWRGGGLTQDHTYTNILYYAAGCVNTT